MKGKIMPKKKKENTFSPVIRTWLGRQRQKGSMQLKKKITLPPRWGKKKVKEVAQIVPPIQGRLQETRRSVLKS